ncbi:MAG: anaerobic sulfatase maturase [Firmicutes bacterium]|nr:anaerobic sulfatase maturase [Candidatus Fermentithermobacillaceae bacterium]
MTKRSAEPFTVMAKPVGPRCNLACSYCYYLETEGMYGGELSPKTSDGLLETYIRNYIEASPGPVVSFIWHGGEPTLAGLEFYRKAVELQERYLPPGWSCWNNLQTNGILLDDEWCSFLAEARFDVGLSIDGNESTHDTYRRDRGGHGTYERVAQAARRLKAHGIRPDLLCTVTSTAAEDPLGVYRALRDLDTGWMQFIPIVRRDAEGRVTPDSVTPEDYGDFLCAVFDEWVRNDIGRLEIQQVAEMGLVWSGGSPNLCWMAPTCGRVLIVEQDGAVYSCDHFVTPEHRIGDITTSSLAELVDSPVQRSFGDAKRDSLPRQCRACAWLAVCNGGCPKDRFATTEDGEAGLNYLCSGLMWFFTHAGERLRRIVELRRLGQKPPAIMAQLRAEAQARWRGIGRNDPCPCGSGRKAKHCCWDNRP